LIEVASLTTYSTAAVAECRYWLSG